MVEILNYIKKPRKSIEELLENLKNKVDVEEISTKDCENIFKIAQLNAQEFIKNNSKNINLIPNIKAYKIIRNLKSKKYYNRNCYGELDELFVFFDYTSEYIESNSSLLLFELLIERGINDNDLIQKNEEYYNYIENIKIYIDYLKN